MTKEEYENRKKTLTNLRDNAEDNIKKYTDISHNLTVQLSRLELEKIRELESEEQYAHKMPSVEDAIKRLNIFCKQHKEYGQCDDCSIAKYCLDYSIDDWDNVK